MKVDYIDDGNEVENENPESKKVAPKRILVGSKGKTTINSDSFNQDILVVASKLKKYVKDKHGLNTSANVMEKISDIIRVHCDRAIDNAKREGRKTLMDRDF